MGFFTDLVRPAIRADYKPWDDFWYQPGLPSMRTQSGVALNPDTALRLGAVYACVGLISDMVGSLPLILYRRLENEGKERATTNPLYNLLRRQPNGWQTSKEWLTWGAQSILLRGGFFNEIVLDGRFAVGELRPLRPERMSVILLASGRRGFVYRPLSGPQRTFTQDEIFYVPSPFSLDGGISGCGVIEFARESVATALAQDLYAGRFWAGNATPAGMIKFPAGVPLTDEQRTKNREEWERLHGGQNSGRRVAVLSGGAEFTPVTMNSNDAQFIESRRFSVADVARFFRVPAHMIGDSDRSTSWGTGIEQQTIGFVNFTLMPWLVAFEQAIDRDLIIDERHFAEFLVDALLRGDMAARASAYSVYVMNGIMSENEVRIRENLNPYPGLDVPQRSANQGRVGSPAGAPAAPTQPQPPPDEGTAEDPAGARARALALEAAARAVGRELVAIRKWQPRLAQDPGAWRRWVAEFYGKHATVLVRTLHLEETAARRYGAEHCAALLERGVAVLEAWERQAPAHLAELALKGTHNG